jgi:hypothetical protein
VNWVISIPSIITCQPTPQAPTFPVIFLELEVVLREVDPDGLQRLQIKLLHVGRRRLQDELKLRVAEEPVGVLAVAAIRGAARGLCVAHFVRLGPLHAQKSLRRHGARTHFHVKRLLNHTAAFRPKALQAEQKLLKGERTALRLGNCLG